jgi:hypothetical protein
MEGFKAPEKIAEKEHPSLAQARGIFTKAKDFLQERFHGAKVAAVLTLSLGAFEIAQAQADLPRLQNEMHKILSGETSGKSVTDTLFSEYKTNNLRAGYFMVENSTGFYGKEYRGNSTVSADGLARPVIGDTLDLGDVETQKYAVMVMENGYENGIVTTNEFANFYSAIKPSMLPASNESKEEARSYSGSGGSPEEAIINAVSGAAGFESSAITVVTDSKNETTDLGAENTRTHSKTVQISEGESNTILYNVKVVLREQGGQYFAEVLYK